MDEKSQSQLQSFLPFWKHQRLLTPFQKASEQPMQQFNQKHLEMPNNKRATKENAPVLHLLFQPYAFHLQAKTTVPQKSDIYNQPGWNKKKNEGVS